MAEISQFARSIDEVAPLATTRAAAGIPLSANFNLNGQLPLDDRAVASSIEERNAIPDIRRYDGLVVYVTDGLGLSYQLVGGITNDHWKKYGTSDAADVSGLHTVATSGKYTDLIDTPTKVSEFENDSAYITLEEIPDSTQLGGEEPVDQFTNIWFDTTIGEDEVILDQNEGVFLQSESGVHFKVIVSESGQLSTEKIEFDPEIAGIAVEPVVLRSAGALEYRLGVTDDGRLTTELVQPE